MILESNEIEARLSSNDNLLNRLKVLSRAKSNIVSIPAVEGEIINSSIGTPVPDIDNLVERTEDKINTATAYSGAKAVLAKTVGLISARIEDVESPVVLSKVASDMARIINGFDETRNGKSNSNAPVVIYKPVMNQENYYDVITANE